MNILTRSILLVVAGLSLTMAGCATSKNMAAAPTPAPVAAPETVLAPEPAPTYVIQDVNFDFDKSNLKSRATDTLDHVATELREQPDVRYEVAGFTDSVGSDAYNQGLSERRAVSVRDYLISRGVASAQLDMNGYSESNPIASNSNAQGRAQNRRVEVRPIS
jgi:OmpA-OmpF porin, OOP family